MGSVTKLRKGAMDFSMEGPVISASASDAGMRRLSSSQKASSVQSSGLSEREHWM